VPFIVRIQSVKDRWGGTKRGTKAQQNGSDLELAIARSVPTVSARHAVALFVCQLSLHKVSVRNSPGEFSNADFFCLRLVAICFGVLGNL
jgi:hypothetical protein